MLLTGFCADLKKKQRISRDHAGMERGLEPDACGVFSVRQPAAVAVVAYIQNEARHHWKMIFHDESRRLLVKYRETFDELHVWD